MRKSYWEILDEKASREEYIFLGTIVTEYNNGELDIAPSKTSEYDAIRQWLHRHKDMLDFKNGKTIANGFRYKSGYEYLHKTEEELTRLSRMNADGRLLLRTGGLDILFNDKTSLDPIVELESAPLKWNREIVKKLVGYITNRKVITFMYKQGYNNIMKITLHPHVLKEYNSRWFLFGYVEEKGENKIVCFALDRIVFNDDFKISNVSEKEYIPAKKGLYRDYFKDIVGVTRPECGKIEIIKIQTTDYLVHNLIDSKPIHHSQEESLVFNHEKGIGEFTIKVIPNIELQTRLLSYGKGIRVIGDGAFLQRFRDTVRQMASQL